MDAEKLTPEQMVRLLRAKAAELERAIDLRSEDLTHVASDLALHCTLLADHIERSIKVEEAVVALNHALHEHIEATNRRLYNLEGPMVEIGDPLFNEDGTPWEPPKFRKPS